MMPKMPELKGVKISNFTEVKMDMNSVAYQDKEKEKRRQEKLTVYRETGEWPGMKKKPVQKIAWSKNKAVLDKRREKKRRRAEKRAAGAGDNVEGDKDDEDEVNDFAEDYKLMKKLKKGKMSQDEFDDAFEMDQITADC